MKQIDNIIYADAGKVLRRIADGFIYGSEISLGYTYFIGGILQDPPHLDTPEDFEEIYDPAEISDTEALQIITGKDE